MKILKGPSDEETFEVLNSMTCKEIFRCIKNFEIEEKWFDLAVKKGLLLGLLPDEILFVAAEGGSLEYVKKAYEQIILTERKSIKDLLDDAISLASGNGHLKIVEYLYNKGADINLAFINSADHDHILNFAIENGANINNRIVDKMSGELHSLLWFMLININKSMADYIDNKNIQ